MKTYYLSNVHPGWPIARQEKLLDQVVPGWRAAPAYRDALPPRRRMTYGPADLRQRANLLDPTRRPGGGTVSVASLVVMACSLTDFLSVLRALAKRGDTLAAFAEGLTLPPHAGPVAIAGAGAVFTTALHKLQGIGPVRGSKISAERRAIATQAKCETIRARWVLPSSDYPTRMLCAEIGVSRAAAVRHLGDRPERPRPDRRPPAITAHPDPGSGWGFDRPGWVVRASQASRRGHIGHGLETVPLARGR